MEKIELKEYDKRVVFMALTYLMDNFDNANMKLDFNEVWKVRTKFED